MHSPACPPRPIHYDMFYCMYASPQGWNTWAEVVILVVTTRDGQTTTLDGLHAWGLDRVECMAHVGLCLDKTRQTPKSHWARRQMLRGDLTVPYWYTIQVRTTNIKPNSYSMVCVT